MVLSADMFHRACDVRVVKCGDCVVVVKRAVTFHKLVVIFDEIFGVVACGVFKYTKSFVLVSVMFFSTSGRGSANSSVGGDCARSDIVGNGLRGLCGLCKRTGKHFDET